MKKQLLIGITGGIGGGKSTVSEILERKGYAVYNSDLRARMLQQEYLPLVQSIKDLLGAEAYADSGELNRPWVASRVFSNKALLATLNELVHPVVRNDLQNWVQNHASETLLFVESAIMFESGLVDLMDKIVLITASEEVRIQRVVIRDKVTVEQVRARILNQMSDEKKALRSDCVIYTDDTQPLMDKIERMLDAIG